MRTIKLSKKLTDEQSEAMTGKLLTQDFPELIIDYDCDAIDADTGKVIFKFRKGIIPANIAASAYKSLRKAATPTANRASATEGNAKPRMRQDGVVSNTMLVSPANSGIIGYFDRYPRTPYCRTTAWTMANFDMFKKAYPIIKFVDNKYAELMPEEYKLQRDTANITSPDFVIKDTAFTTVTVNKNWQTAVHTDKGDFEGGFGNLVVLRAGRYEGGHFCVVPYRVGINMNNLDLLLVDVHVEHGNTPIVKLDANAERLSLVMYYRENMIYCGTKEQELQLAKSRKEGSELVRINLNPNNTL